MEALLFFVFIILGFISPWLMWVVIKKTKQKIQRIKRCTIKAEAEIVSWDIDTGGIDDPTWCTPTLRYSYLDNVFEVEFTDGRVTKVQKERLYEDNTMTIRIDPDDATNITLDPISSAIAHELRLCVGICCVCAFFILLAIILLCHFS
ncbi:MAG: hypothetical protein J6K73_06045 [Clostridia bacterium]|nr:hypothetical protein [Clostridia bacterium]